MIVIYLAIYLACLPFPLTLLAFLLVLAIFCIWYWTFFTLETSRTGNPLP